MDPGLSDAEAARRLSAEGPNELPQPPRRSLARLALAVATEPMFGLLLACGALYALLGSVEEAWMLLGFVGVVMAISLVQQRRSEQALQALRELSAPRALVWRQGRAVRVPGREVVRGDIVLLAEGDRVPADLRLLGSAALSVDESLLTGESMPVLKGVAGPQETEPPAPGGAETGWAFAGCLVTSGTGRGEVVATGPRSALGRIGASLQDTQPPDSPVQREIARLVRRLALAGIALALGLALAYGVMRGDWLRGLLAGLTLAMAILPEELPVVLTLFLGLGAWRLAREQVLARQMPAVELLGAATVLCVDKTGTLTCNRMVLRRLWSETAQQDLVSDRERPLPESLHALMEYAVLASHRQAVDPMEAALVEAGARTLAGTEHLHEDWRLQEDYPLSGELLAMSRVWRAPGGEAGLIAAKGAPEAVMDLCHLPPSRQAEIVSQVAALAAQGWRVLGVARARWEAPDLPAGQHDFDFEFLGLLALEDPVRPEVPRAIADCRAAGLRVVMMTGDHPATALSVARQAGLPVEGGVMTGAELAALPEAELAERVAQVSVFCRVQPAQKLRLVRALQARGEVVAMTGDGVNDAPALRAAHIGVAMGARGTDVAREAAALVLLEDRFSALVAAVRHGRRVFANLRKAFVFVLAAHVPIIGLSVLPVLMGWPLLLLPVHVLCLELLIDPACSLVFEAQPAEADAMRVPPRSPQARVFDRTVLWRGLLQGVGLTLLCVLAYRGGLALQAPEAAARALCFVVLVLGSVALILVNRHWRPAPWWNGAGDAMRWLAPGAVLLLAAVLAVPLLRRLFAFELPSAAALAGAALLAALAVPWFEAVKRWTAEPPPRA